jgi:CO/xanthine dehydrogenase FAD-binding subunit
LPPRVIAGAWARLRGRPEDVKTRWKSEESDVNKKYYRPLTLEEALTLLALPDAVVLAGGTALNAHPARANLAAVDLQALHLGGIETGGGWVRLGAMTRLREVVDSDLVPGTLRDLARLEAPGTIRDAATIGGTVGAADPESPLLTGLLAFGARVSVARPGSIADIPLEAILDDAQVLAGAVITSVTVPVSGQAAAQGTARTPMDRPIVIAVAHRDAAGTTRTAVSGVALHPVLVDPGRIVELDPPADFRGSSAYRAHLATVLTTRALAAINGGERP